ncbi:MAG: hypothetical protein RBR28_10645 [Lentimicrobium sp.]|nr:hypothetical protein [Lentimicrobium sp.]
MKATFFIHLIFPMLLSAQDYNKMYYNQDWHGTSIERASYYRLSDFNDTILAFDGKVEDFYQKDNQKEMIGFYKNGKKNGEFTFYYPNGNRKLIANYSDNNRVGTWKEFYKNGILKIELNYIGNKEHLLNLNDSDGNTMIRNNKFTFKQDDFFVKGQLFNTLRDGKWNMEVKDLGVVNLKYKAGILISGSFYLRKTKQEVKENTAFPLINEPEKFHYTEELYLEPGAVIKNNYVLEGINRNKYRKAEKVEIDSQKELEEFIYNKLKLINTSMEEDIEIIISVMDSGPVNCQTKPKLPIRTMQELNLIIGLIEKLNFISTGTLFVNYKVKKETIIQEE